MAVKNTDPIFTGNIKVGSALLGTRDTAGLPTSSQSPAQVSTVFTADATYGSKVNEIVIEGTNTTVAGVVNVHIYDGSAYKQYDTIQVDAQTASNVLVPFRTYRKYSDLILPPGYSLRANHTCASASNDSVLNIIASGGDFVNS